MLGVTSVDFVEYLIETAVAHGASDIHIEPTGQGYNIRMRKDGDLLEIPNLLPCEAGAVQRIKVLAEMDIAERRLPQDGSFQVQTQEGVLDLRVASLPTVHGEKVVIRLLRHISIFQHLEDLQMPADVLAEFRLLLSRLNGMIIATGPTGSGKTTTLLASVRYLTDLPLNIITLEDPVESRIAGVSQVQINERSGLTFAKALRSILRQDPDVIMVGEIRDAETAEIAIRAALTGHLVLTTMHTETLDGALLRLIDLGIEPYLVNAAVKGILSQRLVKRTAGGRIGIFDLLTISEEIQGWLLSGANITHKPHSLNRNRMELSAKQLVIEEEIQKDEYLRLFGGEIYGPI